MTFPVPSHAAIRANLTRDMARWQNPGWRRTLSWYCAREGGRTDTNINACLAAGPGTVIWDFDHTSTSLITVGAGVAVVDLTGNFALTVGAELTHALRLHEGSKWLVNIQDNGNVTDRVIATGDGALVGPCRVAGSGWNGARCETGTGAGKTAFVGTVFADCGNIGIAVPSTSQSSHILIDRVRVEGNVKGGVFGGIATDKTFEIYLLDDGGPAPTSSNYQGLALQATTGRYRDNVEIGSIYRNNGLPHDTAKKAAGTFPNGCADQSSHQFTTGLTRKHCLCLDSGESALVATLATSGVVDRGHFVSGTDLGAGYGSTVNNPDGSRNEDLVSSNMNIDECFFVNMAIDQLDDWQDNPGQINQGSNGFSMIDTDDVVVGANVIVIGSSRMRVGIAAFRSNNITVSPDVTVIGALVEDVNVTLP